jgi:hypothetical protein
MDNILAEKTKSAHTRRHSSAFYTPLSKPSETLNQITVAFIHSEFTTMDGKVLTDCMKASTMLQGMGAPWWIAEML